MRTLKMMALVLAVLVSSGVALHADNLYLGPNFVYVNVVVNGNPTSEGGGSVGPSSLNGVSTPWIYCVDIFDTIGVPGLYPNTTVTHDASMSGLTNDGQGLTGGKVNNAAQVAFLLQVYAAGATTADQQAALQAAIWHEIYGDAVYLDMSNSDQARINYYNAYLTNVGTGNVSHFNWLSPGNGLQGLISPVPDGGATLMLLGGALVGLATLRQRFRA